MKRFVPVIKVCMFLAVVGGIALATANAGKPGGGGGTKCPRPIECLDVWDPVICSDGLVYSNDCYAYRACATGCVPYGDEYAAKKPGGSGCPRPILCPDIWDPVICSDGHIYSNGCYAYQQCATGCVPYGDGGPIEAAGKTKCPRPIECTDIWDPVICSDGLVYSNDCYAFRACATGCVPYGDGGPIEAIHN